jgi:azurin
MTRAARWTSLTALLSLLVTAPQILAAPKGRQSVVARTIHVKLSTTGQEVMFDQQRLELPFAKTIRLKYKNDAPLDSQISHNVAIIRPERVATVMATLQDHDYDLKSVRDSADILALTRVLNPGQEDTIEFSPPEPCEYVYICLMPGHGDMLGMRGILALKR